MNWNKLGLVWAPAGDREWARSHAMAPTPMLIDDDTIRVFVTCQDSLGRGRPGYVDVDANNPLNVLGFSKSPLLDIGEPGAFDDNGVMVTSVVVVDENIQYMYYAGFEICTKIRYRILTGVAISQDSGKSFKRFKSTPILERSPEELFFRSGSFAMLDHEVFKLWYVGGSEWLTINGKSKPVYDLRYLESEDGFNWGSVGRIIMPISKNDEHGFGRPWIVKNAKTDYQLFYSIRRKSFAAYRLGYAGSHDGVRWARKDDQMNLDTTCGSFDSEAIMYSAVITVNERTFCFYNGNDFGRAGFAVAELVE